MEFLAAGDISAEGVHMLSTGGMLKYAEQAEHRAAAGALEGAGVERWVDGEGGTTTPDGDCAADERAVGERREVVVATETGMLYPLRMAAPDIDFIPANAEASCVYMKMITLPKLRDSLREMKFEVRVPAGDRRARAGADRPHGGDRLTNDVGVYVNFPRWELTFMLTFVCARRRNRPCSDAHRPDQREERAQPGGARPACGP